MLLLLKEKVLFWAGACKDVPEHCCSICTAYSVLKYQLLTE